MHGTRLDAVRVDVKVQKCGSLDFLKSYVLTSERFQVSAGLSSSVSANDGTLNVRHHMKKLQTICVLFALLVF